MGWKQVRASREAERQRAIGQAAPYVGRLQQPLGPLTAILCESDARGDFHVTSDIDVMIISDALPSHPLRRLEILYTEVQGNLEPKGYTKAEWHEMLVRRHPAVLESRDRGVVLVDSLAPRGRDTASSPNEAVEEVGRG